MNKKKKGFKEFIEDLDKDLTERGISPLSAEGISLKRENPYYIYRLLNVR